MKSASLTPSGSGMPPTNGITGSTPIATATGMSSPRSRHMARITPRCCVGMTRLLIRRASICCVREIDQLVQLPSGVRATTMP